MAAVAALALGTISVQAQNTFGAVAVGSTSGAQDVIVSSATSGTVKSVAVLTFGAANGDFAAGAGTSTCATFSGTGTCTQSVTFSPSAPGLRMGAVVLLSTSNTVLGTTYLSGTGVGGLGVLALGNVTIVAGVEGAYTAVGDGLPATQANLNLPSSVTLDGAGNMYIADSLDDRVRMVCGAATTATIAGTTCATAGVIYAIAGNGKADYTGDGGAAVSATLSAPHGVALDGAGNLYIADTGNNVIRMISAATGEITTVAGLSSTSTICNMDVVGDGCPATQASLKQPWGVTLDASGNLYIADTYEHRIREVSAATGIIATIAGTGTTQSNGSGGYNGDGIAANAAELNYPYAVAFDSQGNMYIPDAGNQRVREVVASSGTVTGASQIVTFAGTGTQANNNPSQYCPLPAPAQANQTELSWPEGVAVDAAGNVYIADTQNAGIRKVNVSTGMLSTLTQAGCGVSYVAGGFTTNQLYGPMGLYLDGSGNLYIADYYDMVIREVQSSYVAVNDMTAPVRQGSQSPAVAVIVENDGNAPLDLTAPAAGANTALGSSTTCATGMLAVAGDCTIGAEFAPAPTPAINGDQDENGTIAVTEDTQAGVPAPSNPLTVQVFGVAEPVNGTTTTVASTPDPSALQQNVTFTVTVSTGSGTGNLTGTVSIADTYNSATTTLASALPLTPNGAGTTGTATFAIATLGVGQHSIVASYNNSNDPNHFSSSSTDNSASPLIQTVEGGTGTTLASSANPSAVGASVTFTAVVTASGGVTPDGTVTFMDGANALGAPVALATVGSVQEAQYTTSTLTNGAHQITAVYSGDPSKDIQSSTSNLVVQVVQQPATLSIGSSPNPSNYGSAVTFTATIQSAATNAATGTVVFLDNGLQIGTGTLAGNPAVATFTTSTLAVGTHPVTATYAGDNYNSQAQTPSAVNQVVNQAQTSTTVAASPNPGIAGAQETITATVTVTAGATTPSGTVTFTSGTVTLGTAPVAANGTATLRTTLAPALYQVVATYAGNANVNGSASSPLSLNITQATTGTTVAESPTPALVALPITFTATVKGNGGTPTGTVNFVANGNTIGSAVLNGSGVASITTSALPLGAYSVTANYLGDTNDGGSVSSPASFTVSLATTTVSISSTPSPALVGQPITFTASVTGNGGTPTGNVNFIANGNTIGSVALSGGKATFTDSALAAGTYTVTASYVGDADNAGSTSSSISETVELIPTQTDLGSSSTTGANAQVILVATVLNGATGPMATGTVTFNSGTTALGSAPLDSSGVATLTPSLLSGTTYNITAVYGGDAVHAASSSQAVSIGGTAAGFNFAAPATITLETSQNITVAVSLTSNSGFTDTIGLGCASLPVGVTCHFSPVSVNLPANGAVSSQLTIDTNDPLSGGASAMNRMPGSKGASLAGLLPFSAFFGWLLWRQRRHTAGLLTMTLVLALSAAAFLATGCSGFSSGSVAPGTYTIQITGTGANSSITHYQNVTLTITK